MTRKEFFEIAGYFANPIRNSRIEIEAREATIKNYAEVYQKKTGYILPLGEDSITSLPNNANKWGREMRLYFCTLNQSKIPALIDQLKTVGGRQGYEAWNQRLNSREIIDDLLEIGFTLGGEQDLNRIKKFIPESDLDDFNAGFNLD